MQYIEVLKKFVDIYKINLLKYIWYWQIGLDDSGKTDKNWNASPDKYFSQVWKYVLES